MQLVENAVVAGRFKLERLLGRGGMGSVWQALHLGLDIPCAVKFIEGEFATLPEAHVRFEREAKAAAQLRSPHVVQILDHGVWEGRPYIAMELLDGEDLGKRLQHAGRLQPAELNTVMTQVCRALQKAHASGIVHRDLKPDNIYLVRDDDREIAKVLDFGIAKTKSSDLVTGSNTRTGAMLGTPYYMSPEQAQGTKAVDSRSDLWSLAVIAYQCITGKLPFESEALGDLLVKIIVSPIPVPSSVAHVPPGFDAWFAKAASRDPNQRFQSAKEFAASLGMAVGQSAMTEVMDWRAMQAALGQQRGSGSHQTAQAYPSSPNMNTPPGGAHDMGSSPRPFQNTPASAMARSIGTDPAFQSTASAITGAPIVQTYSGMTDNGVVARKPARKLPVILAAAGLVAVLGLVGVVGAVKHFVDKKPSAAAAGDPTAHASATSTDSAHATVAPASDTATPPVVASSSALPLTSATTPPTLVASSTPAASATAGSAATLKPVTTTGAAPTNVDARHTTTSAATAPATATAKPRGGGQAAAVEKMGF